MQALKSSIVSYQPCKRLFSTSSWNSRRVGWTVEELLALKGPRRLKPHRIMWKFIDKTKKKGIFSNPPVGFPSIDLETGVTSIACRSIPVTRKSAILNKMFMRNITEILATSDVGLPLVGHDVQISHVKVTPDFNAVNVFWIPKGTEEDENIQHLLNKTANPLRRELINLRSMGLLPTIYFVKDEHHALMAEVERRLKIADFGEDHVLALQDHHRLREDLQLITTLPNELKEQIVSLEKNQPLADEEEELPEMCMDVFGLNQIKILRRVKEGVVKSSSSSERVIEDIFSNSKAVFESTSNKILNKESWDKTSLKKYIKQRQKKFKKSREFSAEDMTHTHYIETTELHDDDIHLYNEFIEHVNDDNLDSSESFDQRDDRFEQEQ